VETRRVVTGVTPEGKSVFTSDDRPDGISVQALPGLEFFLLWGTEGGHPVLGARDDAVVKPYFPALGGTRFLVVRWAPGRQVPEPAGDPAEISAEAERLLPGLLGVIEPDNSGMHTTDTVDYAFCADGEIWLELDDGQEVHLTPGSCVVQRGTRHAWHNRGDRAATMIIVQIGAERDSSTGRERLGEWRESVRRHPDR
jgi:mannose-6-phosphate isomerase-like protein (cupin superfamily)